MAPWCYWNCCFQVNGKLRATLDVSKDIDKTELIDECKNHPNVIKFILDKEIIREIYVPGKIVNISSIAAEIVLGNYLSSYCASKAAVSHLTRTMAFEYAKYNIQVNAIAPGYILTDLNKNFFETDEGKEMIKTIPQKRLGKPEELDGALLLLCSELGSFMTGVDGGHVIG